MSSASNLMVTPMVLVGSLSNPNAGTNDLEFTVTIENITSQPHYDTTQTYSEYNRTSIKVGDWVSNYSGGSAYQITYIDPSSSGSTLNCTIQDTDGYLLAAYQGNYPNSGTTYIFRLNEDGFPLLLSSNSVDAQSVIAPSWQVDLMSHFASRNNNSQYVSIYQPSAAGVTQGRDFVVGESIYVDSSGIFRKSAGSDKISDTVGIVTSKGIPSDDWFSFRPSGKYFDTTVFPNDFFPTPAIIQQVGGNNVTLTAGMKLYINPNSGRQYTTVAPTSNPYATWIMISATRAIYIAGSGGGGGGSTTTVVTGTVQVFDGGDPTWASAPPEVIYPVLDCGGI